jgi:hypothetical protein
MQENSPATMPETKNKTFVLVSAILLISIAVIIAIFFRKNQDDQKPIQDTEVQEQEDSIVFDQNQEEGDLLFTDLMVNRQGSYICQIEDDQGTYVYYFDNERIAIDVKTPEYHMKTIVDEDFTYNWDVDKKLGTKFSNQDDMLEEDLDQESDVFDEEWMGEMEEEMLPEEDVGPFDPANFVCRVWSADEAVFTPPADIVFQDLTEVQEQMMEFVQ